MPKITFLTGQQKKMIDIMIRDGKSRSEAYREVYVTEHMSAATIDKRARIIMRMPKVKEYYQNQIMYYEDTLKITKEKALTDLKKSIDRGYKQLNQEYDGKTAMGVYKGVDILMRAMGYYDNDKEEENNTQIQVQFTIPRPDKE